MQDLQQRVTAALQRRLEREAPELKGLPHMAQMARELGLHVTAIRKWLKKNRLLGSCPRHGRYVLVPLGIQERYFAETSHQGAERVIRRPAGYVGARQAADQIGCSVSWLFDQVKSGKCRAVYKGKNHYYHRDDVAYLRMIYRQLPLPGYLEVYAFAKSLGANHYTPFKWFQRQKRQLRQFRRLSDGQMVWFALAEDLEEWRRYYESYRASLASRGQVRQCRQCGVEFTPVANWGYGYFCSKKCQHCHYTSRKRAGNTPAPGAA